MPGGPYTYPGVYIEEVPSGVHPISGVSTSNTAFVDFFAKGPIGEPIKVTSFDEFEHEFGGLHADSEASYAIFQYFVNGGSTAFVVRASGGNAEPSAPAPADQPDPLKVEASSPGAWGDALRLRVTHGDAPLFNLVVERLGPDGKPAEREEYLGLTNDPDAPRYALQVVNRRSELVRLTHPDPTEHDRPDAHAAADPSTAFTGGANGGKPNAGELEDGWGTLTDIAPEIFNLLCLPGAPALGGGFATAVSAAAAFCHQHRAFLLVDVPEDAESLGDATDAKDAAQSGFPENAAIYFPRLVMPDPLLPGEDKRVPASGAVAGVVARTDAMRGVWKAPAGTDAGIGGVRLPVELDDIDNGTLNVQGINVVRTFPVYGTLVWGSRTLDGADAMASEWKYVPVRRTALYIEESLATGLRWAVFEPNDEPLWSSIRLNVGAFMDNLYRQGAFAGSTPAQAYLVKCDKDTTRPSDQDKGVVNILVGFAPLKPAEFVVLKIQQLAGQSQA
jgi:phage tail sheath protein FI